MTKYIVEDESVEDYVRRINAECKALEAALSPKSACDASGDGKGDGHATRKPSWITRLASWLASR